jgi:ferredoxin
MCEFCVKHGEGKKWYLQAKNYSDDLAADIRRQRTTARLLDYFDNGLARDVERLENDFPRLPRPVRRLAASLMSMRQKKEHFGQVVPIDDIERVFGFINAVVRVPCVCRTVTVGREVRYCLAISASPRGNMLTGQIDSNPGPDVGGMDALTTDQALEFMRGLEKDGVMHSVWTFGTPFIGAICNCDRSDCFAMRSTVKHGVKVMFKAEYAAVVDRDLCTGCRGCLRLCQFGAMGFSSADRKACIDPLTCYGCGVCRAGCSSGAISLLDRARVRLAARSW